MPILKDNPKRIQSPFKHLQPLQSLKGETNLGGDFALPVEFNSKKYASSFVPKGNAVTAAQGRQALVGTNYTAEGWSIWKYPDEIPTGDLDEKGKPEMMKHPKAGEKHEVTSRIKDGGTFTLMFRDKGVQEEVNRAYGELSRDRMAQEAVGQTVAGANVTDDPGMLGGKRLPSERAEVPEDEQYEPPVIVESGSLPTDQNIVKKTKKLSR